MKAFKYVLIGLIVVANLLFAQPSFADPPKFTKNPEYKALIKEINQLRALKDSQLQPVEGYTPEQIENKLNELEFLKYGYESGVNWGQCQNTTGKTLGVYGPPPKNVDDDDFPYDAGLYFLADGQTTQNQWDCKGIYIPTDVTAFAPTSDGQNQELASGTVVSVPKGTQVVISSNPDTGAIKLNIPVAQNSESDQGNWFIPKVSQAFLDTRARTAPTNQS
jgi:hypothetical protein